jgi:hypothetical protein
MLQGFHLYISKRIGRAHCVIYRDVISAESHWKEADTGRAGVIYSKYMYLLQTI